jgi:RNA polymerase sigma factor (sigma-70 family)
MDDGTAATGELVRRARRGDRAAFGALVGRYERTALAMAFGVTGDANTAGDATLDAFLRAWQSLAALKDDARFGRWLCGIVRNRAVDLRRRANVKRESPSIEEAAGGEKAVDPAAELDRSESIDRVAVAIEALDETSRTMIVLRYYEEMSSAAVAELLETTPAAVDMRLSRARSVLKQLLGDNEHEAKHDTTRLRA